MEYAFNVYNKFAADGAAMSVEKFLSVANERREQTYGAGASLTLAPVVLCVGSDLAIGDCLGPITGSMLKRKTQGLPTFIYGTLSAPVTAKEIRYMRKFLKETHPRSPVIAVDAAVGGEGDIGLIKISDTPLRPGAGANKNLGTVGDLSVMGIVAEKSVANYALLNQTRLNLVYKMSEIISDALANLLYEKRK
jgi:putative sporulation protein YyaC